MPPAAFLVLSERDHLCHPSEAESSPSDLEEGLCWLCLGVFPTWGNTDYQALIWKGPASGILCLFKCRESFLNEGATSQQQNAGRLPLQVNITEVINIGTSLAVCWLRPHLPKQEVWVPPVVGELRFHTPHGQDTQT